MGLRSWCGLSAVVLITLFLCSSGFAATVTVNAAAAQVPGSIYSTIKAAGDNLAGGDTWGDGVNDTILVTDDEVIVEDQLTIFHARTRGGSITVRNNPGDTPVIAVGGAPPPLRLFKAEETLSITFDGLIIIGAAGVIPTVEEGFEIRTPFWFEATDPDDVVNFTIKNCVVTRNKGENVPEMDYSVPFDDPTGTFQRFLYAGDDPYRGLLSGIIEDCVFAFIYAIPAALQFDRRVDPGNPNNPATRTLTVRRTLITKIGRDGHILRARDVGPETTYNFIDCCFTDATGIDAAGRGLYFDPNALPQLGMNVNVTHCIFDMTGGGTPISIDGLWVGGTLTVDGATFVRPGADMIDLEKMGDGEGSVTLRNIISASPDDSVFRWRSPDGVGKPGTFVVSNINTDGDPVRVDETHPDIIAAFDADYGGMGPFHDDPVFVSTDIDSTYAGIRRWDSTANALFDVNNPSFAGKGSGGSNLVGGAECPACGTGVEDWNLY